MANSGAGARRANWVAARTLKAGVLQPVYPKFHAECDVAALVYRTAEDPDGVLAGFTYDLRSQGFDAVGLLQRHNPRERDNCEPVEFLLVPAMAAQRSCSEPRCSAVLQCGIQLQDLGERLGLALERNPDIVVLNRFGWLEANGSGLLNVLTAAIEQDIPVAIAVPEALFDRWLTVSQGLAVKLSCDRASLDRWWNAVRRSSLAATPSSTFCEYHK